MDHCIIENIGIENISEASVYKCTSCKGICNFCVVVTKRSEPIYFIIEFNLQQDRRTDG